MKKTIIMKMGIVGTLILIVLSSGCISSSTNKTKTFSDGAMSFNYPADFYNGTYSDNNTNSSSTMQVIGYLENTAPLKVHNIMVGKNISATSLVDLKDKVVKNLKNESSSEILSINTETNPNNVVVDRIIYKEELIFGIKTIYSDMYFKINDNIYAISVYGVDTELSTQNVNNTANIIFQSIK